MGTVNIQYSAKVKESVASMEGTLSGFAGTAATFNEAAFKDMLGKGLGVPPENIIIESVVDSVGLIHLFETYFAYALDTNPSMGWATEHLV